MIRCDAILSCAVQLSLVNSCDTTAIPCRTLPWLDLSCIAHVVAHSLPMHTFLQHLCCHHRENNLVIASGPVALSVVGIFALSLSLKHTHTLSLSLSLSLIYTLSLSHCLSFSPTSEGHGTHVSGSVAGNSLGVFGEMDGMAPDAKISFFDIGNTHPCP
jgi:Subtilase family